MRYMVIVYNNPTEPRSQGALGLEEISTSGELVTTAALADPVLARTVQIRNGAPQITDGPSTDAQAQLAGLFIVDCDTPERVVEIAADFPGTRAIAVEIRPVMNASGMEM